jgi:hypothetical protein
MLCWHACTPRCGASADPAQAGHGRAAAPAFVAFAVRSGCPMCVCACLRVAPSCPPPSPLLQLWGNATHIAPELHREANRVSNTALVAELHFDKQVSSAVRAPYQCHRGGKTGSCVMASPEAVPAVAFSARVCCVCCVHCLAGCFALLCAVCCSGRLVLRAGVMHAVCAVVVASPVSSRRSSLVYWRTKCARGSTPCPTTRWTWTTLWRTCPVRRTPAHWCLCVFSVFGPFV